MQFITLRQASEIERLKYDTFQKRVNKNKEHFKIREEQRSNGGRPLMMIAVSSLSAAAQRRYYKDHPDEVKQRTSKGGRRAEEHWFTGYSSQDFALYREQNPEEVTRAETELETIHTYLDYQGRDKTTLAETLSQRLGISSGSFFNRIRKVRAAQQESTAQTKQTGEYHGYLEVLALCRKPSDRNKFPSLTEEMRQIIQQAFFGSHIRNRQGYSLLCEMALQEMEERDLQPLPSESMMIRYYKCLMEDPITRSAREYQGVTLREWKNRHMVKGKNDTTGCLYLEHIQGDAHTLDFWSEVTHRNGKKSAVRLQLVTWIDVKTRRVVGYELCLHSNSEIIARSVLSVIYGEHGGVPQHLHIDNGKDYTPQWLTGQNRKERADNGGFQGVFKQLGIEDYSRSKPYEPWGKAIIERLFNSVRRRLSCKQESYTGMLTGKETADKIPKDINAMLKSGKLPTMEKTAEITAEAIAEYNSKPHRGLKDAGETYTVPDELMAHCEHYEHAPLPVDTAKLLILRPETASVTNQGIRRFNQVFDGNGLEHYVGQKVKIRYSSWNKAELLVTDIHSGDVICTAYPKAMMKYGDKHDPVMIEGEKRKKRQLRDVRQRVAELVGSEPSPRSISSAGLENAMDGKVVAFSDDPEVRGIQRGKMRKTFVFDVDSEDIRELEKLAEKNFMKRAL